MGSKCSSSQGWWISSGESRCSKQKTLTFLEHNTLVVRYFLKSCGIPCNTGGEDHVLMGCTIGYRTQATISASLVML